METTKQILIRTLKGLLSQWEKLKEDFDEITNPEEEARYQMLLQGIRNLKALLKALEAS